MALYLLQFDAVQFSTLQQDATLAPFSNTITDKLWLTSCRYQRVRNIEGVCNFNFLTIVLILSISALVIGVGGFIEPVTGVLRRVSGKNEDRALTWVFGRVLQLQRLAYGAAGVEKCQPGVADVLTTNEKVWPVLDLKVVATADSASDLGVSPISRTSPVTPISTKSWTWVTKTEV